MNCNKLGKSDLSVSEIAFGCMSLGNNEPLNKQILHQALDHGINFFDTADIYSGGQNEISVGNAFKGMRDKIILATKVGNQLRADGSGLDWNPSREHILKSIGESLKRLGTDYIDLYQLHGGTIDDPIDETVSAFEQLKKEGKIREYGISSIRPNVIREYVKRSNIVSVMMQYSLLDRRPEESCLDLLQENNISVITRGSLAQGILINKPAKPYLNYSEEDVKRLITVVRSFADKTSEQIALKYVLHYPAIASVVAGIRSEEQLISILKANGENQLSPEEINILKSVLKPNLYEQHR